MLARSLKIDNPQQNQQHAFTHGHEEQYEPSGLPWLLHEKPGTLHCNAEIMQFSNDIGRNLCDRCNNSNSKYSNSIKLS